MLRSDSNLPRGPLPSWHVGSGFPHVALHRHGRVFRQESSYWHLGIAVPCLLAAGAPAWLPLPAYAKWALSGFAVCMGVCAAAPYYFEPAPCR